MGRNHGENKPLSLTPVLGLALNPNPNPWVMDYCGQHFIQFVHYLALYEDIH